MTDETEELDIVAEVDTDSRADWLVYDGGGTTNSGQIVFPHGVDVFCQEQRALAVRIADKTGEIEVLRDDKWETLGKAKGKLAAVK